MLLPGIEPETLCVWSTRDNHYTTETTESMDTSYEQLALPAIMAVNEKENYYGSEWERVQLKLTIHEKG